MISRFPLRCIVLSALVGFSWFASGCETTNTQPSAVAADEQYVQPTGSRIGQRVKKGSSGVAKDMPGGTSSAASFQQATGQDGSSGSKSASGN